jgi:hypothetical protein
MFATAQFTVLSSRLLSKRANIKRHIIEILPVVLSGCETCSPTSKEDHKFEGVWEHGAEENKWT